jgi:hypothetical protein
MALIIKWHMREQIEMTYSSPRMKRMEKRKEKHLEGLKSFSRRPGKVLRRRKIKKKLKVKKKSRRRRKKKKMKHLKKRKLHQRKRRKQVSKQAVA